MLKNLKNYNSLIAIAAIVLIVAIIVVQFIPCWTFKQMNAEYKMEEKTTSIAGVVWFPRDNSGAYDMFNEGVKKADQVTANDMALPVVAQTLLGILSIYLLISQPKAKWVGLLLVAVGIFGLYGNIFVSAFAAAKAIWIINIILSALLTAVGAVKLFADKIFKQEQEQE